MKQDIRGLFKKDDASGAQLPDNHREEFYDKLKASQSIGESKLNTSYVLKVAAIVILGLAFTLVMYNSKENVSDQIVEESSIEIQIDGIEKQYLASIDEEWQNFISIANDDKLVKRYKEKLDDLDNDYSEISSQFKADNNNIIVIEALVDNLKTRLQLLKDIQEHIKLLNQKTEVYETTSI